MGPKTPNLSSVLRFLKQILSYSIPDSESGFWSRVFRMLQKWYRWIALNEVSSANIKIYIFMTFKVVFHSIECSKMPKITVIRLQNPPESEITGFLFFSKYLGIWGIQKYHNFEKKNGSQLFFISSKLIHQYLQHH